MANRSTIMPTNSNSLGARLGLYTPCRAAHGRSTSSTVVKRKAGDGAFSGFMGEGGGLGGGAENVHG